MQLQHENVNDIAAALRSTHGCEAAILYGSMAAGDATASSDYDVAGFCDVSHVHRIAGKWRDSYLDVFLYPLSRLVQPEPGLVHMRDGRVLFDTVDGAAARLLAHLREIFSRGPEPLSPDEVTARRGWAWKMLDRARVGDPEGNFRRTWLLTALLEDYFLLAGRWYPGSKKGLAFLDANEPRMHALFRAALEPGAGLDDIEKLVEAVAGERDDNVAELLLRSPHWAASER